MGDLRGLRKGNCVLYNNAPHILKNIEFVVCGTHCHTKAKLEMENLFTGKKVITDMSLHENLQEIGIIRKSAQVLSKSDNSVQIMDLVDFNTYDASIDPELLAKVNENDEVTYVQWESKTKVIDIRK